MSIIINRVSCIDESQPVSGATLKEYFTEGCLFPYKVWLLDMTIEEAIHSFGKCVVSYNPYLGMFHVIIYDDYIE